MGLEFIHETFSSRSRVERFFGYLKQRTKRFHNNINTEKIESIVDIASAIAMITNFIKAMKNRGGVIPS